jgi:hypothetical protein
MQSAADVEQRRSGRLSSHGSTETSARTSSRQANSRGRAAASVERGQRGIVVSDRSRDLLSGRRGREQLRLGHRLGSQSPCAGIGLRIVNSIPSSF